MKRGQEIENQKRPAARAGKETYRKTSQRAGASFGRARNWGQGRRQRSRAGLGGKRKTDRTLHIERKSWPREKQRQEKLGYNKDPRRRPGVDLLAAEKNHGWENCAAEREVGEAWARTKKSTKNDFRAGPMQELQQRART
jgi:hypothetical protein